MKKQKQEIYHEKKKRSWKKTIVFWIAAFFVLDIIVCVLFSVVGQASLGAVLHNKDFWLAAFAVDCLVLAGYLMLYKIDAQNVALKGNDLEDSSWMTQKEMKKLREFSVSLLPELKDREDALVIGAVTRDDGKLEVTTTEQMHALIVGTTGTGKTTGCVDQNIELLSMTKTKPSMIITDPKGELTENHMKQLVERGYKVSVLNFRRPYSSQRWNPMQVLTRRIHLIKEINHNLENKGDGKYRSEGVEYNTIKEARIVRVQELWDEIYDNAKDLVYTLCPVQNAQQPNWEQGARNLIFALVLAMCEDCAAGKIDEKQMQLFNVYHNITKYCSEDTTVLKNYLLNDRSEFSKVRGLANTVLITSDRTLTSYLSEVNSYMQQLSDDGVMSMLSDNELDVSQMDEEPNAVFVIFSDERVTRHRFTTLFITQAYKELVDKADMNARKKEAETMILKRRCHFILDEFGNLPKFEGMTNMVTVARSRGIRFLFILQSFTQLNAVYGNEIAGIIRDNCNVKMFIGTDDPETRKAFSELCGQRKTKQFSVNTNVETPASSSTGATLQPLISVGELELLNGEEKGNAIVSVRGYRPIWSHFTPSYKLKDVYFPLGRSDSDNRPPRRYQKEAIVFDIGVKAKEEVEKKLGEELNEHDRADARRAAEQRKRRTDPYDKKWESLNGEAIRRIKNVCEMLSEEDAADILNAEFDNKAMLLYALTEHYSDSVAANIRLTAEYLENEAMPQMKELERQAARWPRASMTLAQQAAPAI